MLTKKLFQLSHWQNTQLIALCFVGSLFLSLNALAVEKPAYVAIIIDDMGDSLPRAQKALKLPGALTFSILPHTPYSKQIATSAYKKGIEVMLHMPMQPESNRNMGPGGLNFDMSEAHFAAVLKSNLSAIPHVKGVNNHMGSLLTQKPQQMQWLMQMLNKTGDYFFVDSVTHQKSVAKEIASQHLIPSTRRDVFLDHEINLFAIDKQFILLIEKARQTGFALAIGHPHNATLLALEYWIPQLKKHGIELVPVSQYISLKHQRSILWQASLSHSRKAAKN